MFHGCQTRSCAVQDIPSRHTELRVVTRRTKSELFVFFQCGLHYLRGRAKKFNSIGSFARILSHPSDGLFRSRDWFLASLPESCVSKNSRSSDLVLGAQFFFLENPIQTVSCRRISDRGNTMGHP